MNSISALAISILATFSGVFAQSELTENPDTLLKSTNVYSPNRCNPRDAGADCTQFVLTPKGGRRECQLALESIEYQPRLIFTDILACKVPQISYPMYQWFVNGPVVTAADLVANIGVGVQVMDSNGNILVALNANGAPVSYSQHAYYDIIRAMALNKSSYNNNDGTLFYSTPVWNYDGQYYIVTLFVPTSNLPVIC